jgi:hypothetical protein
VLNAEVMLNFDVYFSIQPSAFSIAFAGVELEGADRRLDQKSIDANADWRS